MHDKLIDTGFFCATEQQHQVASESADSTCKTIVARNSFEDDNDLADVKSACVRARVCGELTLPISNDRPRVACCVTCLC